MSDTKYEANWRVRVLVVEDDEDLQKIMKINLEHEGFEVIQAYNGKECLRLVQDTMPDVVLLDLMMPEMDGFEACKRIKSQDSTREIPVIIVSAKETIKDKLRCFNFQADDYMTKPYEYEELAARIYLHLNKVANGQELRERERRRAVKALMTDLSNEVGRTIDQFDRDVKEILQKIPQKYGKLIEGLAWGARDMFFAVERAREKHDPLYESPHLPKETVDTND